MNKRIKSLVLSATLVASIAILGGCGSNNIGYVDTMKVANSTEKGIAISQEINAKKAELNKRIDAADDASKQNVYNQASQELTAFTNAKAQEYRQYQEQKINELVKEKKLDVVIEKGAVVGGGADVTEELITKMGKASDTQIKEAEEAIKAEEQQEAQQNAQQAGQAATGTTEAAQ
ncbi:hypothetical protein [uncultured Veillonella sp.]|uniref:hypothetical protein n=1 Tax=uncultured Veillonella sp. TaxID=159268 RepID=UPI0026242F81|nr:hypothetical protein [uncultured Veillonella sp.]